jgi:hypothetical protein
MRFLKYILWTLCIVTGCVRTGETPEPSPGMDRSSLRQAREAAYVRTERKFERALFWSPDPQSIAGDQRWMSPLIVEELDPLRGDDPPISGFGRLIADATGHFTADPDEPTVYHGTESVEIRGTDFVQSTYLWFYPTLQLGGDVGWRGFRMLLDRRGYAIVWEILSSETELRVLFVSKPIEDAARRQYGSALPGRCWVVEPCVQQHADLVVARIVGDGPQPMGPFLYLDYPARRVSTLICRCEPSQVDLFPDSRLYWLAELENEELAVRQYIDRVNDRHRGGSLETLRLALTRR